MLFRNYAYLDESRDVWPELLKIPLLASIDEEFVETTKYHLQQCTLPSLIDIECNPDVIVEDENNNRNRRNKKLFCDGKTEESTEGSWIREPPRPSIVDDDDENTVMKDLFTSSLSSTVSTRVRVRKIRKDPILFEWAIQPEPEVRWWPKQCKIKPVSREDLFKKFGGKRIVISGDSQLRALYYATVNTLLGNGDLCVRNITTQLSEPRECVANVKGSQRKSLQFMNSNNNKKSNNNNQQFLPIQVDYIDDLFLNRIKQKLGYNYEIIICGFGQHPASKEHWRFDKYAKAVDQRMAQLKSIVTSSSSSSSTSSKVIWYTAPHYPHTKKGYPVVVKDWRTDSRLELFNNYSSKVAKENGFAVVDSFAISDAFMHTSPDQAHFSNFVASEFVRMLFSVMMMA